MLRTLRDYVIDYSGHYRGYCQRTDSEPSIHKCLIESPFNHLRSLIVQGSVNIHDVDCCGRTLLHCAVIWGREKRDFICSFLLTNGANVNAKDNVNRTALHLAVFEENPESICKILLAGGADPNVQDSEHELPIHLAVQFEQSDLVKILIAGGADVEQIGKYNRRLLEIAVDSQNCRRQTMCSLLLAAGANVNASNKEGQTALHLAVMECRFIPFEEHANGLNISCHSCSDLKCTAKGFTQFLIEQGARINIKDKYGRTPLHYASMHCQLSVVQVLLQGGAEVNVQDRQGRTPGHYSACANNGSEIVKELLAWGTSIVILDKNDETSLDIVKSRGHTLTKRAFKEFITKMKLLGLMVNETLHLKIDEDTCFQEKCIKEVEQMKNVGNNQLTLYDCCMQIKTFAASKILDLEKITPNLNCTFPQYAILISAKFRKAKIKYNRSVILNNALNHFVRVTRLSRISFPPEILSIILSNLENEDLTILLQV